MKTELSKIAQDLEQGTITDNEAQTLLLGLLGVVSSLRLSNDEIKEQAHKSLDRTEHYNEFERQGYYHGYKNACYWMRKKINT